MARLARRVKDGARMREGVLRRLACRERSGSGLSNDCEGNDAASLIPWWVDRRNSSQRGIGRPVGAVGARTGPGPPRMLRQEGPQNHFNNGCSGWWKTRAGAPTCFCGPAERRLFEIGLRGSWLGGVLAGRVDSDIVTAGSLSGSGGEQDYTRQRQGNHEHHTNPPNAVERRPRIVVAVFGHCSSSRSRDVTVILKVSRGLLNSEKNPALFLEIP
jgi:hypothetical protein